MANMCSSSTGVGRPQVQHAALQRRSPCHIRSSLPFTNTRPTLAACRPSQASAPTIHSDVHTPAPLAAPATTARCQDTDTNTAPRAGTVPPFLPLQLLQAAICSAALLLGPVQPSTAVLNSPNAQIARSVDAALRRSIPAFNPSVDKIQGLMEDTAYFLRIPQRKPWGNMASNVATALALVEQRDQVLQGVPKGREAEGAQLLDGMYETLKRLELAVKTQQPDAVSIRIANVLEYVANLELLQAPGLPFIVAKEYQGLPRLTGRAVVEFEVEKRDGSLGFVNDKEGGASARCKLTLTLDGYSAPISAGNFLKNVQDGLYDGRSVAVSSTSLYVQGKLESPRPPIPLEILPAGEFEPVYRLPLDVQQGELPVLPLSISGAVTMAHLPETDSYLSGDEWFIYKFDKQQAGLAGLAFDEGTFGVFGYVTGGMDAVPRVENGDVIVSARVVSGAERLVLPAARPPA